MWVITKQAINKKKASEIHDNFIYTDKEITDPQTITDGVNIYFVNIGPTLTYNIPDIFTPNIPSRKEKIFNIF